MTPPRVPVERLVAFATNAYVKAGVPAHDAAQAARLLVQSDLAGQDWHGMFRLPHYIAGMRNGRIAATADIKVIDQGPGTALVDGANGLGHLVMARASEAAIAKAQVQGVAWVGVRRSNHAGAASIWPSMMLPHDMIGIYLAVGSANFMAPWGGFERLLGTNPIAIAVPAHHEPPVVVDMATSVAANGKVQLARQRGETLPIGWMIDRTGTPITDPQRADEGVLLPAGDYKGYALSLMIGLLAGTLNTAAFGREPEGNAGPSNTGQAVIALAISRFGDPLAFKARIDHVVRDIRGSGRLPGVDAIRLPGERSYAIRQERLANGVPIPSGLCNALDQLADDLAISRLERT